MKKNIDDWWEIVGLFLMGIAIFIGAWQNELFIMAAGIVGLILVLHWELGEEIDKLGRKIK